MGRKVGKAGLGHGAEKAGAVERDGSGQGTDWYGGTGKGNGRGWNAGEGGGTRGEARGLELSIELSKPASLRKAGVEPGETGYA